MHLSPSSSVSPRPRFTALHRPALAAVLLLLAALSAPAASVLPEGDFATWENGKPAVWGLRSPQAYERGTGPEGAASLKVTNVKALPGKSGEVLQTVPVKPQTDYILKGQARTDTMGGALLQVKTLLDGKEKDRLNSKKAGSGWTPVSVKFNSGASESVIVLLRWAQEAADVGKASEFAHISLEEYVWTPPAFVETPPRAEATYHCLGLYWKLQGGSPKKAVTVHYRKKGDTEWKEALPLWFDATEHGEDGLAHSYEYRGSIVGLTPDTAYEIKLAMDGGPEKTLEARTRTEDFKIARRVKFPTPGAQSVTISEGGTKDGYVLYEPSDPSKPWDGGGTAPENIKVEASYVILKGFNLKNAKRHGIVLGNVHDVVIDGCDVSGWGETGADGQALDLNAAIFSSAPDLERITIQNCSLHHPRSDSNSWAEERPGTKSKHPQGPQGIVFRNSKGGHVIRFNKIYSDMDHMFNDAMGDTHNFSYAGFPTRDSDIHDNFVSHCWDDGLEIEGADMNVRVWNNYIDLTYGAIGAAAPSLGPLYIFRNVYAVSRKHSGTASNDLRGHYLVKLGNERPQWTKGRMYVFHNTTLQPGPFPDTAEFPMSGAQSGIVFTSDKKLQENIVTRNNLLQMRTPNDWAIRDTQKTASNDFDYDMHDGRTMFKDGSEPHGLIGAPKYQRTADGRLALVPGTPGHDAGARLPNFNDDFAGNAPDIGAVETDGRDAKPALWPAFPEPAAPQTPAPQSAPAAPSPTEAKSEPAPGA
jgi:hypothetical protein